MDDLSFVRSAESVTNDHVLFSYDIDDERREAVEDIVRQKLTAEGWEGDGDLGLIWLPPFALDNPDTYGTYVWHVKQRNNGTSWIASTEQLFFNELLAQNRRAPQGVPVHILFVECRGAIKSLRDTSRNTIKRLASIRDLENKHEDLKLESVILEHAYCDLVQQFHHFLDACYLVLLQESLQEGNYYKIKLRLPKAKFSFDTEGIDAPYLMGADAENWLIKNQIISSIWHAFKFEPFNEKIKSIPKSVGLKWDPRLIEYLKQAVAVRNCFQHHSGQLHQDALRTINGNAESITMRDKNGTYQVNKWDDLTIHEREFHCLCYHIRHAVNRLNVHVNHHIYKRYYLTERGVAVPRLFE